MKNISKTFPGRRDAIDPALLERIKKINDWVKNGQPRVSNLEMFIKKVLQEAAYEEDEKRKLQPADRDLYSYVRGGSSFVRAPSGDSAKTLMKKYPIETSKTVFRGMMFDTKEGFQGFIDKVADGRMETTAFTSWTPDVGTAFQFAVTRPSFQITRELSQFMMKNPGETLMGKGGVIISTDVGPGDGIDVSKFKYAAEREILLEPRVWKIKIVKKLTQFEEMIEGKDVNDVIRSLIEDNGWEKLLRTGDMITGYETKGLFDYIFGQKTDQLDQKSRELIGEIMNKASSGEKSFYIKVEETAWKSKKEVIVVLGSQLGLLASGFFGPPHTVNDNPRLKKMSKEVDKMTREVVATMKKNPDAFLAFYGNSMTSLHGLVDYGSGSSIELYKKMLREIFGKKYHELNKPRSLKGGMDELRALTSQIEDIMKAMAA